MTVGCRRHGRSEPKATFTSGVAAVLAATSLLSSLLPLILLLLVALGLYVGRFAFVCLYRSGELSFDVSSEEIMSNDN